MKSSLPPPTKEEILRIDRMRPFGCVACAFLDYRPRFSLELHHILQGNKRLGHAYTIFLCRGHHQGDWSALQKTDFAPHELIAISDGRKAFNAVYPDEKALYHWIQNKLGLPTIWPTSKILPRRLKSV